VADTSKLLNLINYAKKRDTSYSGSSFPSGYHQLTVAGQVLIGQRNPLARLAKVPYDFRGRSVLDVGCNEGGMVLALADEVRWAVGVDSDSRLLNVATRLSALRRLAHVNFYCLDLELDPLSLLGDLVPEFRVDITFFMAMCDWVPSWRNVIQYISHMSDALLFETNGSGGFQLEQIAYDGTMYPVVQLLSETSEDDPQWPRKMLLATNGS
jgi:SAM-dependent methyltransferase